MTEKRNIVFDAIKAFAIWLVVVGHSIQYVSGLDYWNNAVFQIIYSFHMPLFFVVSGFFFVSSIRLGIYDFFKKKSVALLLPCFVWAVIYSICEYQDISTFLLNIIDPRKWPFWFLKGLFKVQSVIYLSFLISNRLMQRYKHKDSVVQIIAIVISFIVFFFPSWLQRV